MVDRDVQANRQRTLGVVVIGNEVLSAKFRDENTPQLLHRLAEAGVRVGEVAILPDDVQRIATVVRDFSQRFDFVLTTGGVGPTHDDRTWEGVALALGRDLAVHGAMVERIAARTGQPLTDEQLRMTRLPPDTELLGPTDRWPLLQCGNVFVLPGVPSMVALRLDLICRLLASPRPHLATVFLSIDEWLCVPAIDATVAAFPQLDIGSYPIFDHGDHRLRVTFEGFDAPPLVDAVGDLLHRVGLAQLVRIEWRGLPDDMPPPEWARAGGAWPR